MFAGAAPVGSRVQAVCAVADLQHGRALLSFAVRRNPAGTVQPRDMWKMLAESFGMPWKEGAFICTRTGAFHEDKPGQLTGPLDPGAFQ